MNDRVAVLVIHGMGSQKPYETLDQFARGVEASLSSAALGAYKYELRFRQHDEDPTHQQLAWTQAYVRLTPSNADVAAAASQPALIDVAEYYWAPIINDRVSALESLRFLIRSALSPFQYLRANALVIDQASDESPLLSICRELARSCFIFFPFLLLLGALYGLLAEPLLRMLTDNWSHATPSNVISYFWLCSNLNWPQAFILALVAFRWLLILMCLLYFVDVLRHPTLQSDFRKKARLWDVAVSVFLLCLLAAPFLWHPIHEVVVHTLLHAQSSVAQNNPRNMHPRLVVFRWFVHRYLVFAPVCLRLVHVAAYLLFGALIYAINRFLTAAIGGLAVYLGSDSLNKNFVARSQILSECTAAVRDLLKQPHTDLPASLDVPQQYDRVILAAHSLGTVIAYDTLNDLRVKHAAESDQQQVQRVIPSPAPDLSRITALFTFGCPLNKVFYFFRSRTSEKTTILNQVLYTLHNFRLRVPPPAGTEPPEPPGNEPFCRSFNWLNVWCRLDMISGPMLFYRANNDERVRQGFEPATAHLRYWANPKLYTYFSRLL